MTYEQACTYLFEQTPAFQRQGNTAYRPGLERIEALCAYLGNPQERFRSIHIAGTNGKGSSAHMLASVLQAAGYRVGLHTSPHMHELTERFRLNGIPAPADWVCDFVERHKTFLDQLQASFFEITVAMAFSYFAEQKVDWAVVEVGLGGRLDATNLLCPELSLITHIGLDHEEILGDTLAKIAGEKAGIIKSGVPVVISERQAETIPVFQARAAALEAALFWAEEEISDADLEAFPTDLPGSYQKKNLRGVLTALKVLERTQKVRATEADIARGLQQVRQTTGLRGRWQVLGERPLVVADVAHNPSAIRWVADQLSRHTEGKKYVVLGFSKEKTLDNILPLLPKTAYYFFTQFSGQRALSAHTLREKAATYGLGGEVVLEGATALEKAVTGATPRDIILVAGSIFLISELL